MAGQAHSRHTGFARTVVDMSNQSSQQTTRQQTSRQGALRRAVAGIAAAGAIAFGGVGTLSAADASAAGVRQQTYVVQSAGVQVQGTTTASDPKTRD